MTSANGASSSFNGTVDILRLEHLTAARSTVRDPVILKELEYEIERDIDSLRSFLFAAQVRMFQELVFNSMSHGYTQVIDEISPRSKDSIIGYGERLACKIMTAILRDRVSDRLFETFLPLLISVLSPGCRCRVRLPGEHCTYLR